MPRVLWSIAIGFVVGLIARSVVSEAEIVGFWVTAGLGITGSIAGCFLARLFSRPADGAIFTLPDFFYQF